MLIYPWNCDRRHLNSDDNSLVVDDGQLQDSIAGRLAVTVATYTRTHRYNGQPGLAGCPLD